MDDTPIVPGDAHPAFEHEGAAHEILTDAELDLRNWAPSHEPIPTNAGNLSTNAMPGPPITGETVASPTQIPAAAAPATTTEGSVAETTTDSEVKEGA